MSGFSKDEIIQKSIKVFSLRVLGYGFGFLYTWIIASKYGANIQGIFSIAFMLLLVSNMISKLGLEIALVKWVASLKEIEKKKYIYLKALKIALTSAFIFAAILFLLAPLIALMYNKPNIEESIKYASFAVPLLVTLEISSNFFKGEKNTTFFGLYYHFGRFFFPFLFISWFYLNGYLSNETPIISFLLGLIINVCIIQLHIYSIIRKKASKKEEKFSLKYMVIESYPMMVSSSIVLFMGWSDVFVLGFFVEESQIGIYSTAIKLAALLSFMYNAIITISTPKIAEFYNNNKREDLRKTVNYSSKIIFITGLPIFLIIFIFPEFFLGLFGEEYILGKNVLRILLIAQLTNIFTGPVGPIFQMTGRQKKLQSFIIMALIINITLSLILVNFIKLEGVAIASALGMIFWNLVGAIYIKRKMELRTWPSLKNV